MKARAIAVAAVLILVGAAHSLASPGTGPPVATGPRSLARIEFAAAPNPFQGGAALHFAIPAAARVTLKVFDVSGRLVTTLVDENLSAGRHRVVWESARVSPGVYMAILQAGTERETRKLTLLP